MKSVLILSMIVLILRTPSLARDPDVLPYDYQYGERETVGGSEWSSGDTFIAIALPIAVVLTLALPHIFSGNLADQSLGRIASWDAPGSGFGNRVKPMQPLFPRYLNSGPIPVSFGWVSLSVNGVRIVSHIGDRKSGYPPLFKFPTRRL